MGLDFSVNVVFKNKENGDVTSFMACYWRKAYGVRTELMNFARHSIFKTDEDWDYTVNLKPEFLHVLKNKLLDMLKEDPIESVFSNSMRSGYIIRRTTANELKSLFAWEHILDNLDRWRDELENSEANEESPCLEDCFEPEAVVDAMNEQLVPREYAEKFLRVLYNIDHYDIYIEMENSY